MKKQITELLEKYSDIKFTYSKDKELFLDFLENISEKIKDNDKLEDLLHIIEGSFIEYTKFDSRILYNPIELIDALLESDLEWLKLDSDENIEILTKFSEFEKYLKWEIEDKEFLEKKYWVRINLVTEDMQSVSAWIYWKWLSKVWTVHIMKKIKKLLSFYPITFIKNIKLDQIVVVRNFYKEDIYWKRIALWGFETSWDNNIYLSSRNLVDSFDHELYHQAMQYYDDYYYWSKIRKRQKKKYLYKYIDRQVNWFARNYWKENVSEDQATMAEELIMNYYNLNIRIRTDKKLLKKLKLVKRAYLQLSDWVMDEKFWISKYWK